MDSYTRVKKLLDCARNSVKDRTAEYVIDDIRIAEGYAEPGYGPADIVVLGNWNEVTRWNSAASKSDLIDDTPARLANLLEQVNGVELEWSDEWTECCECYKTFRTSGDCYAWQMSGTLDGDHGPVCDECIDPEWHLEDLERDCKRCNTISSIDPEDHGYTLIEGRFDHGFHPGQDASPELIGQSLERSGITRYLFDLDSTGQFDLRFSVYIHDTEIDKLDDAQAGLRTDKTDGPSVSEGLKRSLQAGSLAAADLPDGSGVKYITCKPDGTAEARLVSPEEFINGIEA